MNINKIIRESINRVITEGFAGKDYENLINSYRLGIRNWLNYAKQNYVVEPLIFDVNVSLDKYNLVASDGTKISGSVPVHVRICYRSDYVIDKEGISGESSAGTKEMKITITATNNASFDSIKVGILHELTHIIDKLISIFTRYTSRYHQPGTFLSALPQPIVDIIYRLWDTSEFNAWQSQPDLNEFVEEAMEDLQEANEIEDEDTWTMLGAYLEVANGKNLNKRNRRNPQRIKKYFISTSFNKLKKFIKKYKL